MPRPIHTGNCKVVQAIGIEHYRPGELAVKPREQISQCCALTQSGPNRDAVGSVEQRL